MSGLKYYLSVFKLYPSDGYLANAAMIKGKTPASVPPVTMKSASPFLINLNASPIACAPAAHAVDGATFGP